MTLLGGEPGAEEGRNEIGDQRRTDDASPEAEHVHVVVLDALGRGVGVVADAGTHALHLVRGHAGPYTATAEDDAPVGSPLAHGARDGGGVVGIVHGIGGMGPAIEDLVPGHRHVAEDFVLQREARMVASYGNVHRSHPGRTWKSRSPGGTAGSYLRSVGVGRGRGNRGPASPEPLRWGLSSRFGSRCTPSATQESLVHVLFDSARPRPAAAALCFAVALMIASVHAAPTSAMEEAATLELVASWPVDVEGGPTLRAAHTVWIERIEAATTSIDLAHFYASNEEGSRLEPVVRALENAAARGVRIRFLTEDGFYATYPETLDRLAGHDRIEVRRLRTRELLGGVLHTKAMLIDEREAFVGSQNFDWRALEHIAELGVLVRDARVARAYGDLFETDWRLAAGATLEEAPVEPRVRAQDFPVELDFGDGTVRVTPVLGCQTALPEPGLWDWPRLLAMIETAERSLELQALSYSPVDFDRTYWPALDNALRAAALRGVQVRLLVSHWDTRTGSIEHLQSLQCIPGIDVRIATVPEHESGFIPYARVIHSKLIVADGERAWVGTSNFQRNYFYAGRHAGLLVEGASFAAAVLDVFVRTWNASWTESVDPARTYEAPRVGE